MNTFQHLLKELFLVRKDSFFYHYFVSFSYISFLLLLGIQIQQRLKDVAHLCLPESV